VKKYNYKNLEGYKRIQLYNRINIIYIKIFSSLKSKLKISRERKKI